MFKNLQSLECDTVLYQRGWVLKPRSRMASVTANSDHFCRSETRTLVGSECLAAGPAQSLGVSSSPTDLLSGCACHQPSPAPSSMPGFTLGLEDHVGDLKAFSDHHSAATSELESHLLAWQHSPHPLAYTGLGRSPGTGSTLCTGGPSFFCAHSPSSYPGSSCICTALRLWPGKAWTYGCCQGHRHRVLGPWRMPDLHLGDATNFPV